MSQYKRMVSYMYQYVVGEKGQNIGFVRIEQKGQGCRIVLQMRTIELPSMPEVWLYKQNSTGIEYVTAGKLIYNSGSLGCRIDTEIDNVCGSGCAFKDFDGALIYISDREYYGTTWNKDNIYIGEMTKHINVIKQNQEVSEAEESLEKRDDTGEVPGQEIEQTSEEKESEDESSDKKEQEIQTAEYIDNNTTCVEEKAMPCDKCPYNGTASGFGERMLGLFPVMYPFASGDIVRSVRIEPKDIGCLPVNKWSLSNNRFLLHGYYCYRHLIFVKLKDGKYAIGVPGVYNEKADKAAHEYSFSEFQAIGTEELCFGAFGYWLMLVE